MKSISSRLVFVLCFIILILILTLSISVAFRVPYMSDGILSLPHAGPVGGIGIPSQDGYILKISAVGTAMFDMLVMDNESWSHYMHGENYDFVKALSRFNVTTTNVEGELPPGYYWINIIAHSAGNFTVEHFYGPTNLLENPLVLFTIYSGALIIGLAAWYFFFLRERTP